MAPMNAHPLHALRRGASLASPAGRLALCLLLVAPLCSAACGGHAQAPAEPAASEAHADCHGMAAMAATDEGAEASEGDAATDECCDAADSTRPVERTEVLPDAVALFTAADWPWADRARPARARPPPAGHGRSPGRALLLLIVSFLE
jgi:hypothetical protein